MFLKNASPFNLINIRDHPKDYVLLFVGELKFFSLFGTIIIIEDRKNYIHKMTCIFPKRINCAKISATSTFKSVSRGTPI